MSHPDVSASSPTGPNTATGADTATGAGTATPTATGTVPVAESPLVTHHAVSRVKQILDDHGMHERIVVLGEHAHSAQIAAEQLGISTAQIVNSLVFSLPGADGPTPLLILTSGAHRVDLPTVAALLGVPKLGRADAEFVRQHSGYAIGGVAPVGHIHPPRVVIDAALANYSEVWAAAGHPKTVFRPTYAELIDLTSATAATVSLD